MPTDRCPTCDKPRAGDVAVSHADGCACAGCLSVCWSDWGVMCEPVDWRARAIAAEPDAERWRKVAPLIERMRPAVEGRDVYRSPYDLIDAVHFLLAATKEP